MKMFSTRPYRLRSEYEGNRLVTDTSDLRREHSEIIRLSRHLLEVVQRRPFAGGALADARLALSVRIRQHIEHEHAAMFEPLRNSSDPAAHEAARAYSERQTLLQTRTTEHRYRWTPREVAADPDGYLETGRQLLLALEEHVAWEERVIYPVFERLSARHRSSAG